MVVSFARGRGRSCHRIGARRASFRHDARMTAAQFLRAPSSSERRSHGDSIARRGAPISLVRDGWSERFRSSEPSPAGTSLRRHAQEKMEALRRHSNRFGAAWQRCAGRPYKRRGRRNPTTSPCNIFGCRGTQPAVLAAVERGGLRPVPSSSVVEGARNQADFTQSLRTFPPPAPQSIFPHASRTSAADARGSTGRVADSPPWGNSRTAR